MNDYDFPKLCCATWGCGDAFKFKHASPKNFSHPGCGKLFVKALTNVIHKILFNEHRIRYPMLLVDIIEESDLVQRPCSVQPKSALGDLLRRRRRDIDHGRLATEGDGCKL